MGTGNKAKMQSAVQKTADKCRNSCMSVNDIEFFLLYQSVKSKITAENRYGIFCVEGEIHVFYSVFFKLRNENAPS